MGLFLFVLSLMFFIFSMHAVINKAGKGMLIDYWVVFPVNYLSYNAAEGMQADSISYKQNLFFISFLDKLKKKMDIFKGIPPCRLYLDDLITELND